MNRIIRNLLTALGMVVCFASSPVAAQEIIDLLLKNGHVIDPYNERSGRGPAAGEHEEDGPGEAPIRRGRPGGRPGQAQGGTEPHTEG